VNLSRALLRLVLGRRLPTTSGTLRVTGLTDPVTIRRDGHGIPHIEAEGDADAWYGLGFCQGQDRAFQVELLLRMVRGTLAELIGPDGVQVDRFSRRIGFLRSAQLQLEVVDRETRSWFDAFARGVNDGSGTGCRRKAHEFALQRSNPTPYTAADVLGFVKFISFTLASNWEMELARLKILNLDGTEALERLEPEHSHAGPANHTAEPMTDRLREDLSTFMDAVGVSGASNAWAVAASRTATGRPLLANDPHLPPRLPSYWYLAHIRTPGWAVAGTSMVGAPGFPAGHNGAVAWGVTAGLVDNTDLFIEEIGPDGLSVREGDEFVACERRREVIRVKGKPSIVEDVLVTPRGPIVGPALEGEVESASMRATWLDSRPIQGLLHIHRARNSEEFRSAFEQWPLVSLCMAYADTSNSIGWQLVGDAPRRRKGWGMVPRSGWEPDVGWHDDPVPFDQMPQVVGPKCGYAAAANNDPTVQEDGPFLGTGWLEGYRHDRIVDVLSSRHDWDVQSTLDLQMDAVSLPWRDVRESMLNTPAGPEEACQALDLLRRWDGVVGSDSPAAAVFELFVAEMTRRVVEAVAPRSSEWALGRGFTIISPRAGLATRRVGQITRLLQERPEGWLRRPWTEEIADALTTVVRWLRGRYGDDSRRWTWGRVRPLTLIHPIGERRLLGNVFNLGHFPWGGDTNTVSQGRVDLASPDANPGAIATMRMVVDVGNWEASRFILPGGQSGNPMSPHYDDMLPLWQQGDGVPIAWSSEEVGRVVESTLRLLPEPPLKSP